MLTPKLAKELLLSSPPIPQNYIDILEAISEGKDDDVIAEELGLGDGRNIRSLNEMIYKEFKEFFE